MNYSLVVVPAHGLHATAWWLSLPINYSVVVVLANNLQPINYTR